MNHVSQNDATGVAEIKVNNMTIGNVNHELVNKRKTRQKSLLDESLQKIRNLWSRQVDKSVETRIKVIENAVGQLGTNYSMSRFWEDLFDRMKRLLDSKRFAADCEKYDIDFFNAASYIALEGKQKIYNVLDFGIETQYSNRFEEMKQALFKVDDFRKYDAWSLLPKATAEKDAEKSPPVS